MAPPRTARLGDILVTINVPRSNREKEEWKGAQSCFGGGAGRHTPAPGLLFARERRCPLFFSASCPAPSSRILFLARGECSFRMSSPSIFLFFGVVGSPKAEYDTEHIRKFQTVGHNRTRASMSTRRPFFGLRRCLFVFKGVHERRRSSFCEALLYSAWTLGSERRQSGVGDINLRRVVVRLRD